MQTRRFVLVGVASALLCLSVAPLGAQTVKDDPAVGTWLLNRGKSQFSGNPPEKRVIKIEVVGDAIRETIDTQTGGGGLGGGSDRIEFTAKFDGKDVPISNSVLSTVSLKRIDKYTVERTGKFRGDAVETRTRVVSDEGKTMTVTTKGTNGGVAYSSTQVFERQ